MRSVNMVDADDIRPTDFEYRLCSNRLYSGFRLRRLGDHAFLRLMWQEGEGYAEYIDIFGLEPAGLGFDLVGRTAQATPNHLLAEKLAGEGAQAHDVGDGFGIPTLGEHPNGNHALNLLAGFPRLSNGVHL